jgi:hypothetical protein
MTPPETDDDDGDSADDERLLFGERREETTLLAGSDLGVTQIAVAAAQVGQFSLLERCAVRDIAADSPTVIVGTDEDVFRQTNNGLQSLGFGPVEAVGVDADWVYAADADRVARLARTDGETASADDWETVGAVEESRRFVGNLLAADNLVRVGDVLESLGLEDVHDLSQDGTLVAAETGLYERRDGEYHQLLDGAATAVVAEDERAHAVVDGRLYERKADEWVEQELPGGAEPARLAYGETLVVVDTAGTIHVGADPGVTHDGHGGWRSQPIGLRGVTALVAV